MKYIFIFLIKLYKILLSPIIGGECRFNPTCSEYAIIVLKKHGTLKGGWMAIKRVARCNPWSNIADDEECNKD